MILLFRFLGLLVMLLIFVPVRFVVLVLELVKIPLSWWCGVGLMLAGIWGRLANSLQRKRG